MATIIQKMRRVRVLQAGHGLFFVCCIVVALADCTDGKISIQQSWHICRTPPPSIHRDYLRNRLQQRLGLAPNTPHTPPPSTSCSDRVPENAYYAPVLNMLSTGLRCAEHENNVSLEAEGDWRQDMHDAALLVLDELHAEYAEHAAVTSWQ